jgi:putative flavoprotein involved in K+ transport
MATRTEPSVESNPRAPAEDWLGRFSEALTTADFEQAAGLFLEDGWWRDLLALDWDLHTFRGHRSIAEMLRRRLPEAGLGRLSLDGEPTLVEPAEDTLWIEATFSFETGVARGRGLVRLVPIEGGEWRAWTLLTAMHELFVAAEPRGPRRPTGVVHGAQGTDGTWFARRERERQFSDRDPEVLVIGAGQGGLSIAARLGQLGVDTLVIEQNPRVGDNWRNRYESLVLHDPVWADHLPFVDFPDSWPIYTPKDKLGDWFESYAATMELNVWTDTQLLRGSYDDEAGVWTVRVMGPGGERDLRPRHVVLATGALGEAYKPDFPGAESFGGTLLHSSEHGGAAEWEGSRAVVVGACNSGLDIAQDFEAHGADITVVQRSSTYVMTSANGIPILFGGLYYEGGPATEDADLIAASYPLPVLLEFAKAQTAAIAELDRELLDGLERAGFKADLGDDGGGLMSRALHRGGGYYIDVGCAQLIVDGKVKVHQGAGVERLTADGVLLSDGSELRADVVVLATGYANMRETARRLFGDAVADRCTPVWGLDDEGELNTIWRPSGHPQFWFMGGSLQLARVYSRYLALQIKAELSGVKGG